jgi:hypothetical protein
VNILRRLIKSLIFWVLLVEVLLIIVFIALGFRITYAPKFDSNWNAIGAVGQWAGAFVGLLIPIAAIYIQYKLDKNREQIGKSNTDLLTELQNFKDTYEGKLKVLSEMVDENGDIVIDGGEFSVFADEDKIHNDFKSKALKFVNIAMVTNTQRVAENLEISNEIAFDILQELVLHDRAISCGGRLDKNNMDNIVWLRK